MVYVEILGETPVLPGWEPGQVVQCSAAQLTLDRPATLAELIERFREDLADYDNESSTRWHIEHHQLSALARERGTRARITLWKLTDAAYADVMP
jgi:hypothetical protein